MEALEKGNSGQLPENVEHADGDWEVELASALVESLGREENEDVGESDENAGRHSFYSFIHSLLIGRLCSQCIDW